ncbi:MAG: hypothetical protein WCH10_06745 [bacterium]
MLDFMPKLNLSVLAVFSVFFLIACTAERNYRGVADPFWRELSGEQKQLIVDQAYERDFGQDIKKEGNHK